MCNFFKTSNFFFSEVSAIGIEKISFFLFLFIPSKRQTIHFGHIHKVLTSLIQREIFVFLAARQRSLR